MTDAAEHVAPTEAILREPRAIRFYLRQLAGDHLGILGLALVTFIVGMAILSPSIVPLIQPRSSLARVSGRRHGRTLGTDQLGRDTSRASSPAAGSR